MRLCDVGLINRGMNLTIATIDTVLYKGEAKSVTVPTVAGEMTILPKHMPIISLVSKGKIILRSERGTRTFDTASGFLKVGKNETIILL